MPDRLFEVSGRDVTLKYKDMGDSTFARVVYLSNFTGDSKTYRISGRAVTIKYGSNGDGTHGEVLFAGASTGTGDRIVEISGRALRIKYKQMPDGTFAERVWAGTSNQATDIKYPISGNDLVLKYRDMGDGTYALVVWPVPSSSATDKIYRNFGRGVALRYRNMGDGTFAEVVYDNAPLDGLISSLFSDGEPGGIWVPQAQYLWQDASTPVTALEQVVGLWLDASKAPAPELGPNLVVNGTFDANLNNWTLTQTAGGSLPVWDNGAMKLVADGTGFSRADQSLTTVPNRLYRISVSVTYPGAGGVSIRVGTSQGNASLLAEQVMNSSATFTYTFVATGTTSWIRVDTVSNNATGYLIDNVVVQAFPAGNHLTSSGTSRPRYRARYNLLERTEAFDNAAWVKGNSSVTANAAVAPDGTLTADKYIVNSGSSYGPTVPIYQKVTLSAASITLSIYAQAAGINSFVLQDGSGNGGTFNLLNGTASIVGGGVPAITNVGGGWYLCKVVVSSSSVNPYLFFYAAPSGTGDGTSGIYIWGADLRRTIDTINQPAYQRVGDGTAGVLDYDTAGFWPYVSNDGSDDGMSSAAVDFSASDEITVIGAVTKLSDGGRQVFVELSPTVASNSGSFLLSTPNSAAANFNFTAGGSTRVDNTVTTYTAPISAVVTGLADISAPSNVVRVNGVQAAAVTSSQGTGNFGSTFRLNVGVRDRNGTPSLFLNGRNYGLIVRGATTSGATLTQAERYFNQRMPMAGF